MSTFKGLHHEVSMSRHEARGRGQGLLPPYLEPGPPSPDQAQFKPKRKMMTKFFNEPVDALDLRLANAEENLSTLPVDPFTDIKQEVRVLTEQNFKLEELPTFILAARLFTVIQYSSSVNINQR